MSKNYYYSQAETLFRFENLSLICIYQLTKAGRLRKGLISTARQWFVSMKEYARFYPSKQGSAIISKMYFLLEEENAFTITRKILQFSKIFHTKSVTQRSLNLLKQKNRCQKLKNHPCWLLRRLLEPLEVYLCAKLILKEAKPRIMSRHAIIGLEECVSLTKFSPTF